VYVPAPVGDRNLVWFDRSGNPTPLDVPPAPYTVLGLSRNGKRLLVHRTDAQHAGVWLYDLAERTWRRLAAGVWSSSSAVWSPDEQSVAFTANLQGEGFENLYVRPLDSTGTPERIAPAPYGQFATF
jgi:Tol biopolymer transport system component